MSNIHKAPTLVAARHDLAATADERRQIGRQARILAPRVDLGQWDERNRGHDPIDRILAQNDIRLSELAPLRHKRMSLSPWNFYRGAAAVMAADLASRPHSRIEVQLCGDAHVLNFGLWATPERNLNFDSTLRPSGRKTLPGPFEWDVARLAASLVVAARENGVKQSKSDAAVRATVEAYRRRMRYYSSLPILDIWYEGTRFDQFIDYFEPADRGQVKVKIEKGKETRTSRGAFAKLTTDRRGRPRITPQPPLRVTLDDHEQGDIVESLLGGYRLTLLDDRRNLFDRFVPVDIVRQVVGVGSVGMVGVPPTCCSRGACNAIHSSCNATRRELPSTNRSRMPASTTTTAPESSPASAWCRVQLRLIIFSGWGSLRRALTSMSVRFRDMKLIPTTKVIAPVWPSSASPAATRWQPGPMPAPATPWRSMPTWERATRSPRPCAISPASTQTRTTGTTWR